MATLIQLQVLSPLGNQTFDCEGAWTPLLENEEWMEAAAQPEPARLRETWTVTGCKIKQDDRDIAALVTKINTFLAKVKTRTQKITGIRLVRDPAGANATIFQLTNATHEELRLESVQGQLDPDRADKSWVQTATFTLRVSGLLPLEDTDGLVGFKQEVSQRAVNGYREVTLLTELSVKQGQDAREAIKTFGVIALSTLGGSYTCLTGGDDGVEITSTDRNERTSRLPRKATGRCVVREWGIPTGVTSFGDGVEVIDYKSATERTPDEVTSRVAVSATGRHAFAWVMSQKPAWARNGDSTHELEEDGTATGVASGLWERKVTRSAGVLSTVRVELSGGGQDEEWVKIGNGYVPQLTQGPLDVYTAKVTVNLRKRGANLTAADMPFPARFPAPWRIQRKKSVEDEKPYPLDPTATSALVVFGRDAVIVYESPEEPTGAAAQFETLAKTFDVERYLVGSG